MQERLSWNDIVRRFPNQWVSLSDPAVDDLDEIETAIVFVADPDLNVVVERSKGAHFESHAFRFTGKIHPHVGLAQWRVDGAV